MKITDFVIKENSAFFAYLRQKMAYYIVQGPDGTYVFPVPLEDLGDATLNNSEKTVFMMRYIRKALEEGTLVKYSELNVINFE